MNLLTLTPAEFCAATYACKKGRDFALKYATMLEVWDNCPRVEWLIWIAQKLKLQIDDRTLRLFAVWCARNTPLADGRTTLALLTDQRSLYALEVAERFANGNAKAQELAAALAAARAAAWAAARAVADDALDAAWAAAQAAQAAHFRTLVPNPFKPQTK